MNVLLISYLHLYLIWYFCTLFSYYRIHTTVTIFLTKQMICALRLTEYFDHSEIGYPLKSLAICYIKRRVFIRIVITRTGPTATGGDRVNYSYRLFFRCDARCANTETYRGYISSFPHARARTNFFAFLNFSQILINCDNFRDFQIVHSSKFSNFSIL